LDYFYTKMQSLCQISRALAKDKKDYVNLTNVILCQKILSVG